MRITHAVPEASSQRDHRPGLRQPAPGTPLAAIIQGRDAPGKMLQGLHEYSIDNSAHAHCKRKIFPQPAGVLLSEACACLQQRIERACMDHISSR